MGQQNKIPVWWDAFITEYLKNGGNATQAYRLVRPNCSLKVAEANSSRLLSNAKFVEYLSKAKEKLAEKTQMTREEWLQLLIDVAKFDISEFIEIDPTTGDTRLKEGWQKHPARHALEDIFIQTTTLESGAVVQKVRIARDNKLKALEYIGKGLGYIDEKKNDVSLSVINIIDPYGSSDGKI